MSIGRITTADSRRKRRAWKASTEDDPTTHIINIKRRSRQRTLKVQEDTVLAPPRLLLADHHGGHHLLPQLGLPLLNGGQHHVAYRRGRQAVKHALDALNRDDVQVLSARVVGAVDHSTNGEREGSPELVAGGTTAPYAYRPDSHDRK